MTARNKDAQVSIGTVDMTVTFEPDAISAAPPQAGAGDQGDEVMRLRALLRPIISDLLRDELRTSMRMRG